MSVPGDPVVELSLRILEALRKKPTMTTKALAAYLCVPVGRARYALLWLEREGDVARVGHEGAATVWRIPNERRVK